MFKTWSKPIASWSAGALIAFAGCSADPAGQRGGTFVPVAGAGGSVAGTGAMGVAGTTSGVAGTAGMSGTGTAGTMDVKDPDNCGGMTYKGQVRGKLDIFVVFDLSGSMFSAAPVTTPPGGMPPPPPMPADGGIYAQPPTTYEVVSAALKSFVDDAQSAGIGIALRHFGDECDIKALSTPDVPMGDLPGNAGAIKNWLDAQWNMYKPNPYTTSNTMRTNTYPAMLGAIEFQKVWAPAHPDSKAVILLVTDGAPSDQCGSRDVPGAAAEGLAAKIPTYVLGLGNISGLNMVAKSGGTGQAFIVNDPSAAGTAVTMQLNAIRTAAQPLPCQLVIPQGGERTPDLVNLNYTGPGATSAMPIPRVADASACGTASAWHYDDPTKPTTIIACDNACKSFMNDGGTLSVVVGCPTVMLQ